MPATARDREACRIAIIFGVVGGLGVWLELIQPGIQRSFPINTPVDRMRASLYLAVTL
jgi:hypothetical protein